MPIRRMLLLAVTVLSTTELSARAATVKERIAKPAKKIKKYAEDQYAQKGFNVIEVGRTGVFITAKASAIVDYSNGRDDAIIVEGIRLLNGGLERHISAKNRAVIKKDMNLYWDGPDLVVLFREDLLASRK